MLYLYTQHFRYVPQKIQFLGSDRKAYEYFGKKTKTEIMCHRMRCLCNSIERQQVHWSHPQFGYLANDNSKTKHELQSNGIKILPTRHITTHSGQMLHLSLFGTGLVSCEHSNESQPTNKSLSLIWRMQFLSHTNLPHTHKSFFFFFAISNTYSTNSDE